MTRMAFVLLAVIGLASPALAGGDTYEDGSNGARQPMLPRRRMTAARRWASTIASKPTTVRWDVRSAKSTAMAPAASSATGKRTATSKSTSSAAVRAADL